MGKAMSGLYYYLILFGCWLWGGGQGFDDISTVQDLPLMIQTSGGVMYVVYAG